MPEISQELIAVVPTTDLGLEGGEPMAVEQARQERVLTLHPASPLEIKVQVQDLQMEFS